MIFPTVLELAHELRQVRDYARSIDGSVHVQLQVTPDMWTLHHNPPLERTDLMVGLWAQDVVSVFDSEEELAATARTLLKTVYADWEERILLPFWDEMGPR